MKSKKPKKPKAGIDHLVVGRRAHARVFDQPVIASQDEDESELLKRTLQQFILKGRPAEFRKWLRRHNPDWEKDAQAQYCMGVAFKTERRYKKAEECYEAALEMWRGAGNALKASFALLELSVVCLANDDLGAAWARLDEAAQVFPGSFSSHYNRLCLASVERDEKKLRKVYREMNDRCRQWYKDPNAEHLLSTDEELQFLRDEVPDLWQQIKKQIEKE